MPRVSEPASASRVKGAHTPDSQAPPRQLRPWTQQLSPSESSVGSQSPATMGGHVPETPPPAPPLLDELETLADPPAAEPAEPPSPPGLPGVMPQISLH